jgi:hypothetical protein
MLYFCVIRPMYFGLVVLESCCVMCVYLCTLAWTLSWCRWPSSYCEQTGTVLMLVVILTTSYLLCPVNAIRCLVVRIYSLRCGWSCCPWGMLCILLWCITTIACCWLDRLSYIVCGVETRVRLRASIFSLLASVLTWLVLISFWKESMMANILSTIYSIFVIWRYTIYRCLQSNNSLNAFPLLTLIVKCIECGYRRHGIDDRINWTLWYRAWLQYTVHYYTHTLMHSHVFTAVVW